MASPSQRQRIQQTEDLSHRRQAGSRTQETRQGQQPTTAPLQQLANHSPRTAQLRRLQELANHSPQVAQLRRLQELAISSPQTTQLRSLQELANNGPQVAQLRQLQMLAEKAEPSAAAEISTTKPQAAASQPNLTGLPDRLKSNLEALSGLSMDAVRVHYNSSKPAQLHALAYAQGTDIHIGPGQERHLPHEAWHVVQQAQGRVRPTLQMAAGVAVNDDAGLEREADVMGGRAVEVESKGNSLALDAKANLSGAQVKSINPSGALDICSPSWFGSSLTTPLQMAKDDEDRKKKHRRVHEAKVTIGLLGNNVKDTLQGHVFDAEPIAGGAQNQSHLTGLHAYRNGQLPANVMKVEHEGSLGRLHQLTWRAKHPAKNAPAKHKVSTMFPIWMPVEHVNTLMALKYPVIRKAEIDDRKISPESAKTYIQQGQEIYSRLVKEGDTVYPRIE